MSWKKVKLGEVITHRKEFITIDNSVEYKRCRVQVNRKGIVLRDVVKGSLINTKKQQVCHEGDFLVAEIDAKVGGYGFVPKELNDAIVSNHYFLFDVDETKMLRDYLARLIQTDLIQEQINSKGSTNYAAIRPSHVLGYEIPLPSIKVQKEIVETLNGIYEKYSFINTEIISQQTQLQQLRHGILQEAVQGKLTHQNKDDEPADKLLQRIKAEKQKLIAAGKLKKEKELSPITEDEIPFELPKGWAWCRLGEITTLITKGSSPKWQGVEYVDEGLLFVTSENVDSYRIDLEKRKFVAWKFNEIEPRSILKKGDFLMNIVGGSIGRTAIYDLDEIANINQAVCLIRKETELVDSTYLLHFFNSPVCIEYMYDKQVDNARPNLSMGNISKFLIPIPPFSEQHRIIAKVEQLMQMVSELEKQVQQSQTQAQQLLQAVLKEAFNKKEKVYEENDVLTTGAQE
jgi:type I restriction enzyme S subunit